MNELPNFRERVLSFLPKAITRNFMHELMVAQIMASIELGLEQMPMSGSSPGQDTCARNTPIPDPQICHASNDPRLI